jgi:hypothetical protein
LERDLGMNKMNYFSKVLFLTYHYSHTYELEHSLYVMILAYELAYSFCVMRLEYMTLCLIIHIIYMIRNRAKLRWRFILPSGVPMSYACRSPRGTWVVSLYMSMVLEYVETSEYISYSTVEE